MTGVYVPPEETREIHKPLAPDENQRAIGKGLLALQTLTEERFQGAKHMQVALTGLDHARCLLEKTGSAQCLELVTAGQVLPYVRKRVPDLGTTRVNQPPAALAVQFMSSAINDAIRAHEHLLLGNRPQADNYLKFCCEALSSSLEQHLASQA